ncbi:MAG: hypothetical protein HRT73_07635 [Flavobacteriales bacterium]|nr:hypothetical protein [Flavobacteriales bacterium]
MKISELYSAIISLGKENVLLVKIKDNVEIDEKEISDLVDASLEIVKGIPFYLLVDARDILSSINHESRDYFTKHEEYNRLNIAQAIVVNNMPTRIIANFFFQFYKHQNPVKVFTCIVEGKKWLLTK